MHTLALRAALKRGLLLVAANWQVVLIDFTVASFCKVALALPVLGGALMVASLVGADLQSVVSQGILATADVVLASLATAPVALVAFLLAILIVAVGSEATLFVVKAGTLSVIVEADQRAGEVHRVPFGVDSFARARRFTMEMVVTASRRFAWRMGTLALGLGAIYLALGVGYVAVVGFGLTGGLGAAWLPAWSLLVLLSTSAGIVLVAVVNLVCDLVRVVIVTDDCSVRLAFTRVRRFVMEDARQVLGIFSVIGGIELLAAIVAILAAAGLAPIAYVPFVSLIIVPLQAAVWMLRGLLFELLALSSLSAYQTQYRRFSDVRWPRALGASIDV